MRLLYSVGSGSLVVKALLLVVLLGLWTIVPRMTGASALVFPPFDDVAAAFAEGILSGEIIYAAGNSLGVLLVGIGAAVGLALVFGALASTTRIGKEWLELATSLFNPIPAIGLLPIALLWFGFSARALQAVIAFTALWPMALSIRAGVASVPPTWRQLAACLGKRGLRLFVSVLLPAAFAHFLTGLRVSWAFGWRTLIAGELVFGVSGGGAGLGWLIYRNRYDLDTAGVFAVLLSIMAIGVLAESVLFKGIESRTIKRWGMAV